MTILWGTAKSYLSQNKKLFRVFLASEKRPGSLSARSLLAMFMAAMLVAGPLSPAFAQSAAQSPSQNPPSTPSPSVSAGAQVSSIAPVSSLGLAKYDFTNGPRAFPSLLKPYQQIKIDQPA
ncbi:MAG: hypothetical protein WBR10_18310, partial [Candidatus Acidiferrum sp.]